MAHINLQKMLEVYPEIDQFKSYKINIIDFDPVYKKFAFAIENIIFVKKYQIQN